MHKAKALFYVCAGLFLLALSYHLGARSAGAQAPGTLDVANITHGTVTGASGRTFYTMSGTQGGPNTLPEPIPGTAPVVSTGILLDQFWQYGAVLENGDVYRFTYAAPGGVTGWQYVANIFGNPTPATRETFGALKSRYRGSAQPTTRDK